MVDFLNDDTVFKGRVTTEEELLTSGPLTISDGGLYYGDTFDSAQNWSAQVRIHVVDKTERDQVVAWRAANAPISTNHPLLVWRANGSSTGVNELTYNGTDWYAETPLPGDVEMTVSAVAPFGWVLMQGQLLANAMTLYPALWSIASPALRVGSGLRIPDMRGRVPVGLGQGTGLTPRNMGDAFGDETVVLTIQQLAKHTHNGTTEDPDKSLNHNHSRKSTHEEGDGISGNNRLYEVHDATDLAHDTSYITSTLDPSVGPTLKHRHDFTSNETGDDSPHSNTQPSMVVNFRMKV